MESENSNLRNRFNVSQSTTSLIGYTHVLCCPCCMFFTLSFANLHKHALNHEATQLSSYRTYTCSKCLSTSTEKYLMLEHVNIYHRNTKRPVELTEEIHTILRKSESGSDNNNNNSNKSPSESEFNLPSENCKILSSKTELRRRIFSQSMKSYSKIHQKLKNRSRFIKHFNLTRKSINDLLNENKNMVNIDENLKERSDVHITNENEPIDMTIKNDMKNSKNLPNEKSIEETDLQCNQDFMVGCQNVRSYLFDMLTKNPLPSGLSQSLMLRYLGAQFQSLQTSKYFPNNHFINQPSMIPHHESTFPQRLFENHLPTSMSKSQETSSLNQRNLHRNNFSPFQNHILLEWYDKHKLKPYPSTEETKHLAALCGLSYPQVKKWFANKRARSSFYQKDEIISCQSQARYNLLRFPLQMSNKLNSDVVKSLEAQFSKGIDNLAMVSSSSHDDSIISA